MLTTTQEIFDYVQALRRKRAEDEEYDDDGFTEDFDFSSRDHEPEWHRTNNQPGRESHYEDDDEYEEVINLGDLTVGNIMNNTYPRYIRRRSSGHYTSSQNENQNRSRGNQRQYNNYPRQRSNFDNRHFDPKSCSFREMYKEDPAGWIFVFVVAFLAVVCIIGFVLTATPHTF
jgi:hypothetical protein